VPLFDAQHFKEFTIGFDGAQVTPSHVNKQLYRRGIQGGIWLQDDFPELGKSALYCVTEMHTRDSIDKLVTALSEALGEHQ